MLQVQTLYGVGRGIKYILGPHRTYLMVHPFTVHTFWYTPHYTHLMVHTNYSIQEVGAEDQLKAVLVTKASLIYIRPYLKK